MKDEYFSKGAERGWGISGSFQGSVYNNKESAFETYASGRLCVWLCRRVQACARESAAPAPTGWPVRGREGQSRRSDVPYKTGTGCGGHFERQLMHVKNRTLRWAEPWLR